MALRWDWFGAAAACCPLGEGGVLCLSSLGSGKYLQSFACTRFALSLAIYLRTASEVPRDWFRTGVLERGSVLCTPYLHSTAVRTATITTVAKTGPRGTQGGWCAAGNNNTCFIDGSGQWTRPDAAGVRARLPHSCVFVVSSRRDFTFPTTLFDILTVDKLGRLSRS